MSCWRLCGEGDDPRERRRRRCCCCTLAFTNMNMHARTLLGAPSSRRSCGVSSEHGAAGPAAPSPDFQALTCMILSCGPPPCPLPPLPPGAAMSQGAAASGQQPQHSHQALAAAAARGAWRALERKRHCARDRRLGGRHARRLLGHRGSRTCQGALCGRRGALVCRRCGASALRVGGGAGFAGARAGSGQRRRGGCAARAPGHRVLLVCAGCRCETRRSVGKVRSK